MILELYKKFESIDKDGERIITWKFRNENGDLWSVGTSIDGTEQQAAEMILNSMANT